MSGNLIENAVFTLLDLSHYSSNLPGVAKQRYLEKLNEVGCDCPCSIEHQLWVTSSIGLRKVLPDDSGTFRQNHGRLRHFDGCRSDQVENSTSSNFISSAVEVSKSIFYSSRDGRYKIELSYSVNRTPFQL